MMFSFSRYWTGLVLLGLGGPVLAMNVVIKDPSNPRPDSIQFGVIPSTVGYHTAPQYLEVTHPTAAHRRLYAYIDNQSLGSSNGGLVSTASAVALPLHFHNYISPPATPTEVNFSAATASEWPALLNASSDDFLARKEEGRLFPNASSFLSWVYLGLEIPSRSGAKGSFNARLVIEDWSDVDDVTGPTIVHTPFSNLIMLEDVPVGVSATFTDDSLVAGGSWFYRIVGDADKFTEVPGEKPGRISATEWGVQMELPSTVSLRAPSVMEYYFVAEDTWTNVAQSVHYLAKLVPETGVASFRYDTNTGGVGVAIGDPRWPGLEVQFPAGSLRSEGTMTIGLKDPASAPLLDGHTPARVYAMGPEDVLFNRPVSVLFPYSDKNNDDREDRTGAKEADLRVFWNDGFAWRYVGGTVDPANNQVRANVTHLGEFGLFPYLGSSQEDLVRPLERILSSTPGHDVLRFNTTVAEGPFDIEIFDVRGSSVRKIHNVPEWDGRDESGKRVESGTYVYRFEGQGITLTGMIAVAR